MDNRDASEGEQAPHVTYPDDATMEEARRLYFRANDFGDDGGYDDAWVHFQLGPIPFPFPNTSSRIRAVRFHDLHHVLTGYRTDTLGEFEISAWELGAGCKSFAAAWVLNLSGVVAGCLSAPRRTHAAFVRGRRGRTLYGEPFEALLAMRVADARRAFIDTKAESSSVTDTALFLLVLLAGLAVGTPLLALLLLVVPVGLVVNWLRPRHPKESATR